MRYATDTTGESIEVLGTCTTNTTPDSQHTATVEYRHLWSYAQQAALIAVSVQIPQDLTYRLIADPERRARRIAGHYAQLYFKSAEKSNNKIQFRWPALAAFVVKDIVEAYRFAREDVLQREWKDFSSAARNSMFADLGSEMMTDSSPYQHAIRTYSALAKGNLWLFMDIYPWLWFFLEYGINNDGTLNRKRLDACLPERNWQTFQQQSKTAVEELPYGPNWMGRLSTRLQGDVVYKKAGENFNVSANWSPDGGYGQQTMAAAQAHFYCRVHVKDWDSGYRTPLSDYWGKFKEAYYVVEAEHTEMGRVAKDQAAINTLVKLRNFQVTPSVIDTYRNLLEGFDAAIPRKEDLQKSELVSTAKQEQINVLQPLIYNDPKLKETMDTNHRFSRLTGGWISPKFKVVFSASPKNSDPELEAVFDEPDSILDQISGTKKSLPNEEDRMQFVAQIAKKFNQLMKERRSYMETELGKIAKWVAA